MKRRFLLAAFAAVLILADASCPAGAQIFRRRAQDSRPPVERPVTPQGVTEQIIEHTGFTVSYNEALLIPNWVCWELTPDEAAAQNVSREGEVFVPDPAVRGASAQDSDYRGSEYDRGHMAPAADMKWSEKAMTESFYLSNICPQDNRLNAGRWLELEQKCRWWAKKYKTPVHICCGPMFINNSAKYIGDNEVVVPDGFFKVIAQERDGQWVAAAFIFPNCHVDESMELLARPVCVLEIITGYQFLRNLPEDVFNAVYQTVNKDDWYIAGWKQQ